MRSPRKVAGLVLACVTATVLGVGTGGTAHASIVNTPGYFHLKNGDSGQCLMANADNGHVEQWRCLNAQSEEWIRIPITGYEEDFFVLVSNWTHQCLAIPNYPSNGTPVIQLPCDDNDVRQWWRREYFATSGANDESSNDVSWWRYISLQGALCLDKDKGNDTQGLQIQMWTCNRPPNVYVDQRREQTWGVLDA